MQQLSSTEGSVRDKNRSTRRDALIRAAFELFRRDGYAATTMDGIAERAGLSRRTAFRYFATKDELLFPHREARLALLRSQLTPQPSEGALEAVERACLSVARDYMQHREQMLEQFRVVQAEPALVGREFQLDRAYEEVIEQAFLAHSTGQRDLRRARIRAGAVVGAVRVTIRAWLEQGAEGDLMRLGREAFGELKRGFGAVEESRS